MASKTTNLSLTKPELTEAADINVINNNMDIIDNVFSGINGFVVLTQSQYNALSYKDSKKIYFITE